MAGSNRSIFRSGLFWLTLISFILAVLFIGFGQHISAAAFGNILKRLLYGTVFFLGIVIMELLYLFLTKEEERESRRARREARREERKKARALRREKRKAIKRLKQTFYKALKTVRNSRLYSKKANYNYELPWYLVLGGSSQEQTSLLRHSGLDFPINIEYKENPEDNEGMFQWFFSEEGVFVTVPKIFVTLEKNSALHPVWLAFLKLFKRERWRRPINGIILTVSAEDIQREKAIDTVEYSKVVREKLNEISQAFSSKIPIYLIVTGLENDPAFHAFFTSLTLEEKREVLGITFEDNIEDISLDILQAKSSSLVEKLERETLDNMQRAWEERDRKNIFFYLDSFQGLLKTVNTFAHKSFSKTRYYPSLMLRGIYFADVRHTTGSHHALTTEGATLESGWFIPKVFERIILSERQLVLVNDSYRKKFAFLWFALLSLLLLAVAGTIYTWAISVQQEGDKVKTVEETYKQYLHLRNTTPHTLALKQVTLPKTETNTTSVKKPAPQTTVKKIVQIGKLGGDVSFGRGDASLTLYAKNALKRIIERIKALGTDTEVKIVGHTDSRGPEERNMKLSQLRAKSVEKFCIENGIPASKITTEGKGESRPIASNKTSAGRRMNRRVEIYVYETKIKTVAVPTPAPKPVLRVQPTPKSQQYIIENQMEDLKHVLSMLNKLRSEINDKNTSRLWEPGFSAIEKRDHYVRKNYQTALEYFLLPRIAVSIEKNLLKHLENKTDTERNLKAYLMLTDEKHRDTAFLKDYVRDIWSSDLSDKDIRELNEHFSALLSYGFPPYKLHRSSIFKARRRLVSYAGIAGLIYKDLQSAASKKGLNDFQFLEVLDAYPSAFSGAEYRIPGFYTKQGYEKVILLQAQLLIKNFLKKSWILGDESEAKNKNEVDRIYAKVLGLYFIDYRRFWSKALANLDIPAYHSSRELSDQLELLASEVSPVTLVLRAFRENTFLLTPKEKAEKLMEKKTKAGITAGEFLGSTGSKLDRFQRLGTKTMKEFAGDKLVFDMRRIFKPYHELIDDKGAASRKFKIVLRHVEKVYQQMLEVDTSSDPKQSAFEIVSKKSHSSHKTFALRSNLLPDKLLVWYNKALTNSWNLLAHMADGQLSKAYHDKIWSFYKERIRGRFPLNLNSDLAISAEDFKSFFKRGGQLDLFYKKYVDPFVTLDIQTGKATPKKIDGATVSVNQEIVQSVFQARKIQALLFPGNGEKPTLQFSVKPRSLSPNLAALEFAYGDQALLYEHGPIQNVDFSWPSDNVNDLTKFTLYDPQDNRVVRLRGDGFWGVLRLLAGMDKQILSSKKMLVGYHKGSYAGSFVLTGDMVVLFGQDSPLKKFTLGGQDVH